MNLTVERLREALNYDSATGVFTRRHQSGTGRQPAGTVAGGLRGNGYVYISIDCRSYLAHRLAWFYVHGVWPDGDLDHRDICPTPNWISNLKPKTRSGNMQNRAKPNSNNKSGLLGVRYHRRSGKWTSEITVGGKSKYLGLFASPELAHEAYVSAKKQLHPGAEF